MALSAADIEREIEQQGIPQSWQATYRKALNGNRPAATKAMCGMCQGWEDNARKAIRECADLGCPNHAVRPFQKKVDNAVDIDTDTNDDTSWPGSDNDTYDLKNALKASMKMEAEQRSSASALTAVKSKILDHLHRHGESARGYILFSTGIPEYLWTAAIRELLAENEIEREGEKRSTRYRLKETGK